MRLGRHRKDDEYELIDEENIQDQDDEEEEDEDDGQEVDLSKLKKRDLLEIMLRQGEEIDSLREQIADLEAQLADRNFKLDRVGSIAEASLAVTKIFEEAEKAARIYLENIRSKVE